MWNDAVDLRDFYSTSLGQVARRAIRQRIRAAWPDVKNESVLGLGYATPYLGLFRTEERRVAAAMPAAQGVLHWPPEAKGLTLLADEAELPFEDLSIDRVLVIHALECTEQVRPLMREIWRVLSASGRLLIVAPNRAGLWARFERTPFGHGRPYSPNQLSRLLRDTMFTPIGAASGLFVPPSRWRMVLSAAPAWENIGSRWFPRFAGVVIAQATKQIYAAHPETKARRRRAVLEMPRRTP
jgi:SAM-dependent methyltransferase